MTAYRIAKLPDFETKARAQKQAASLTESMIRDGSWKAQNFKPINFNARGAEIKAGQLHPLLKMREHFRNIFFQMGFQEMPTDTWCESSFWNFDSLFQPQQHPARDAHDTFFLENPVSAKQECIPGDYFERVKEMHQSGGGGGFGVFVLRV